jgi:hypothetical protein
MLIAVGSLALLYLNQRTASQVQGLVFNLKWFLPAAITIPTIVGVILQHKFVKGSKDWDL